MYCVLMRDEDSVVAVRVCVYLHFLMQCAAGIILSLSLRQIDRV